MGTAIAVAAVIWVVIASLVAVVVGRVVARRENMIPDEGEDSDLHPSIPGLEFPAEFRVTDSRTVHGITTRPPGPDGESTSPLQ